MRTRLTILATALLLLAACSDPTVETTGPAAADDQAADEAAATPSALDDPDAPGLPEPTIDLDRLISGGPPPDGIPPIDLPRYSPVDEIDFLADVEPVLVVAVGGETRIFPVQIMTWHEIVNDTIGEVPVTVSFCPLCNSAITYDRRVTGPDGEDLVLDFGTSGLLYNSALVMYDRPTESLWSHFDATAFAGVLTGTELETYPTATVGWATARDAHPDALVLNRETGHNRRYGTNPYTGYDDVSTSPFLFDGEVDGRLAAKTRVIGVEVGAQALAVRTEALELPDVVEVAVGGVPLTVWRSAGLASALDTRDIAEGREVGATGVFDRRVDVDAETVTLTFSPADDGFVDAETGSRWNVLGAAVDGPLAGTELTAMAHVDTFWFAWAAFLPDTTVVP